MDTDQIAEMGIQQIVARVAGAMEAAISEYGPEAVELALLAYRIDAIRSLLIGFLMIGIAAAIVWAARWAWRMSENFPHGPADAERAVARALIVIATGVIVSIVALDIVFGNLTDIPVWLAALGHPEILIATRALQAAGLM